MSWNVPFMWVGGNYNIFFVSKVAFHIPSIQTKIPPYIYPNCFPLTFFLTLYFNEPQFSAVRGGYHEK